MVMNDGEWRRVFLNSDWWLMKANVVMNDLVDHDNWWGAMGNDEIRTQQTQQWPMVMLSDSDDGVWYGDKP